MELQLDKLKAYPLFLGVLCVASIASGSLLIYVYNKSLFLTLDAFKLTVLSIAICLPSICFNGVIAVYTFASYTRLKSLETTFRNLLIRIEKFSSQRKDLVERVSNLRANSDDPMERSRLTDLLEEIEKLNYINPHAATSRGENVGNTSSEETLSDRITSSLFFGTIFTVTLLNIAAVSKYILHFSTFSTLTMLLWNELSLVCLVIMVFIYTFVKAKKLEKRIGILYHFGIEEDQ